MLQRRIELDAEVLCRYDRSRRNHSLLSQRKLVSDADVVVATPAAGWPFFFAAMKNRIGRGKPLRLRILQAKPCIDSQVYTLKSRITARWMAFQSKSMHRFASLGLKSRIDARIAPVLTFWLHRFASLGLKSGIAARKCPECTPWLQRLPSLGLKSRIDATPSCRQV